MRVRGVRSRAIEEKVGEIEGVGSRTIEEKVDEGEGVGVELSSAVSKA